MSIRAVIVVGVSGSGKTTVGKLLAEKLHWPFLDADEFHSPSNIHKMASGIPLTDEDRESWLIAMAEALQKVQPVVLACSALKQKYRDVLSAAASHARFVFLNGPEDVILERMKHRKHHFMKPEMLESQIADLEPPRDALTVDIRHTPEELTRQIVAGLKLNP